MAIRNLPPRNLADRFSRGANATPRASAAPAAVQADAGNTAAPPGGNWDDAVAEMGDRPSVEFNHPLEKRFPAEIIERIEDLRIRSEQCWSAVRGESAKVAEISDALSLAKSELRKFQDAFDGGTLVRHERVKDENQREVTKVYPDKQPVEQRQQAVSQLEAKRDRRIAERDRLTAEADAFGALLRNCEEFLRALPRDTAVVLFEGKAVKPPKGDLPAEIEKLRRQLIAIDEDVADVASAPRPSDEIKAALGRQLDSLARRGKPNIGNLMADLHAPEFATTEARLSVVGGDGSTGTAFGRITNAAALVAWLDRDRLLAALESEVDAMAEDDLALTHDERQKRLADFAAKRLEVERTEVALLDLASERGLKILPRPETDPRAYLHLADELPASKEG